MNKKIIALACAAVIATPMAVQAADVEIYGKALMGLTYVDNGGNNADEKDSSVSVTNYSSRLGFKGGEKLGNGMTAIYQYEIEIYLDEMKETNKTRDAFVGLKGDFGKVRFGRLSTPYKKSTGSIDAFGQMEADFNGGQDRIIGHNTRENNIVMFNSNKLGDFKFSAAYSGSVENDESVQTTNQSNQSLVSVMASFTQGPLFLTAAYESIEQGAGKHDDEAAKVGMTLKMGENRLGAVVDRLTGQEPTIYANYDMQMGDSYSMHFAAAMRDERANNQKGMNYFAVGAKHKYSKTAEVYALFTQIQNDTNSEVGMKKADAVMGETISAISVGMNMKFSSK